MEEVTSKINEFVIGYEPNESLAGLIRKNVDLQSNVPSAPKNYYYVTDLCNPCETYWRIVKPEVKRPKELMRKLFRGKELHKRASYWLSTVDDFSVYEGKIDGMHVGLPRVRGAIDYLIGKKIIDLKTKGNVPSSAEEVFALYPQDIEQVAFYAAIHPENPPENYLLFMQDSNPFRLKAFRIKINDWSRIKSLILDRIKKLDQAIEQKDSSSLGRSRYHLSKCYLCEEGLCQCESLSPLSTESLKIAVSLEYDEDFTKKLTELKDNSKLSQNVFTIWNLLAPLEYYKEEIFGPQSTEEFDDEKDEYTLCLRNLIEQLPFKVNLEDRQLIKQSLKESRLYVGFKWLKVSTSVNPKGTVLPYLIKVSNATTSRQAIRPNPYHMAQLGIFASAYGKSKGLLFVVYPKLNDLIQVYEITYQEPDKMLSFVRELMNNIEEAVKKKDYSQLPPNPYFIKTDMPTQLE